MSFTTIEAGKVTLWERTGELRLFAELVQMPPRLQQAWRDRETGERHWRDVPVVYAQPTSPVDS